MLRRNLRLQRLFAVQVYVDCVPFAIAVPKSSPSLVTNVHHDQNNLRTPQVAGRVVEHANFEDGESLGEGGVVDASPSTFLWRNSTSLKFFYLAGYASSRRDARRLQAKYCNVETEEGSAIHDRRAMSLAATFPSLRTVTYAVKGLALPSRARPPNIIFMVASCEGCKGRHAIGHEAEVTSHRT